MNHKLESSRGHRAAIFLADWSAGDWDGAGRPGSGAPGDAPLPPMFRLLYYLYARPLRRDVRSGLPPRHVGIILDGNRRHGRSLGITEPRELYDIGANKLDEVLEWCAELGIPTVTLWV